MTVSNKDRLKCYCDALRNSAGRDMNRLHEFFHSDAVINVVHPFNELHGAANYIEQVLDPLGASFELLQRMEYIVMGGSFEHGQWVACTGYYQGQFTQPLVGIPPTGTMAFLRFAEFHRFDDGRVVESFIFFDLPALMMAARCWPISHNVAAHAGYCGYLPGPSTGDGVQWHSNPHAGSDETLQITEDMLLNLATPDERWRPYWHDDMCWYGPAAFGAFHGKEQFAAFQTPFEQCFSEWISGIMPGSRTRHFLRMADGNYSCLGGWPSLNMVQVKNFLGQPPGNQRVYMRVCDFWRRDGDKLAENWVFVDILHFLLQLDYDVLAHAAGSDTRG
ncbi:MAG: ester cyclase [Pseudomonadota bacterium]